MSTLLEEGRVLNLEFSDLGLGEGYVFKNFFCGVGLWGKRLKVTGKGQGCVAVRYLTPYFGYFILPQVG